MIFGITGGICCGKSTITNTIREHGIPVVDADIIARELVIPNSKAYNKIINTFGEQYLLPDNSIDRIKLGDFVFSNKLELEKLNSIMHPLIIDSANDRINKLLETNPIVGFDAALIIECGLQDKFRPLLLAWCTFEIQLERLMKRGFSKYQAEIRINSQISVHSKVEHCDFRVRTIYDKDSSIAETKQFIKRLQNDSG